MAALRGALLFIGILATLTGLVWLGQGMGYFPYPSSSTMIGRKPWTYSGIVLAVAGIIAIVVSRRMRGRR